jgi:hypothetical protein
MCSGKHHKRKGRKPFILLLASLVLLAAVSAGTAMAFLTAKTAPEENTFTPSKVACQVIETFEDNVKSHVTVKNTGDTAAYIRAAVVVTWLKDDGSGHTAAAQPVEGTDYTLTYAKDAGWIQGDDGYWYYTRPVDSLGGTGVLIQECRPVHEKAGYILSVEIVASAVQSEPPEAVGQAWGVTVAADGTIRKGA